MEKQGSVDIRLPAVARDVLKAAAAVGIDRVDQVIERLVAEHPSAFHSTDSLPERGFAHEPRSGIPYRWHVHQSIPQSATPKRKDASV